MGITDELRKWGYGFCGDTHDVVTAIADRIDAEHERELAEQLDETSDMREFCGRIEQAAANREDVTLWGVDYVALPVDADGVPIHVGDTVYGCRSGMEMTISELRMTTNGWSISTSRGYLTDAEVTHTRPDSWERIADELEGLSVDSMVSDTNLLSSCALDLAKRIRRLAEREG